MKTEVLHYPRLDTVLMVERAAKKLAGEYPSKRQLWLALPKKTMYQTFCVILDYLVESGKILIDPHDGAVIWAWNPRRIRSLEKRGLLMK